MSDSEAGPPAYQVDYPVRVRERLRELTAIARSRGDGKEFLAALGEFDRRLKVYPQFGEQLYDLRAEPGQVWIGFVRPLGMRYAVFDNLRRVTVGALPTLLPQTKPDPDE